MIRFAGLPKPIRLFTIASLLALAGSTALACGGGKDSVTAKSPASVTAEQIDADPVALLPGSPVTAAYVDSRAIASTSYGEALGRLGDRLAPSAEETGFLPSRDVDSAWAASYGSQGLDGLAVLRGTFDEQKLASAAEKRTAVRGSPIVKSSYAERNVYTVANVGIVVLTKKTALVGSEASIRRSLDRIRDGRLQRSVPAWMLETMSTQGALFAGAGDFETQPLPPQIKEQLPVAWLRNVKTAKVVAMPESGVRVNGKLVYATAEEAQAAEQGLRKVEAMLGNPILRLAIPKVEGIEIKSAEKDVDVTFRMDEKGLATLIAFAQKYL